MDTLLKKKNCGFLFFFVQLLNKWPSIPGRSAVRVLSFSRLILLQIPGVLAGGLQGLGRSCCPARCDTWITEDNSHSAGHWTGGVAASGRLGACCQLLLLSPPPTTLSATMQLVNWRVTDLARGRVSRNNVRASGLLSNPAAPPGMCLSVLWNGRAD